MRCAARGDRDWLCGATLNARTTPCVIGPVLRWRNRAAGEAGQEQGVASRSNRSGENAKCREGTVDTLVAVESPGLQAEQQSQPVNRPGGSF